ncbi:hypothetical protein BZARG_794 [Bizionia argentinensis JUB59]|uniref:Uncharacterized protein n=1 Tax=Bizionia argentinensis JUB59 TaxID=1046627 RepID=G2EBB1_9FLAO|nr:hypothetical protein [Bizionia argentinensis]EGV44441.1 hypothetical protein BZARG_794 [Bizionia argentinensis JUB59]
MSNIVKQGQSFFDKVTQLTGSIENVLKESILNGVSITDDLPIGYAVQVTEITNRRVVGYFNPFNEPATALAADKRKEIDSLGIGAMVIQDTFIVG